MQKRLMIATALVICSGTNIVCMNYKEKQRAMEIRNAKQEDNMAQHALRYAKIIGSSVPQSAMRGASPSTKLQIKSYNTGVSIYNAGKPKK